LRTGDDGDSAAIVSRATGSWDDDRVDQKPPLCAKEIPTFVETTRPKETQSLLRFGRDSNWPLKITVATAIDQFTTLSITYDVNWDGIKCNGEGEISVDWCWSKFSQKATVDAVTIPPAFSRSGIKWDATLKRRTTRFESFFEKERFGHQKTREARHR
jgi:hypothetical protein